MARRCNGGDRGNSTDRRRRSEWLVETFRADQDLVTCPLPWSRPEPWPRNDTSPEDMNLGWTREPVCRCYRCGKLLTVETVTADRIIPGAQGGTYKRNNIRPACQPCNSITGNELKAQLKAA